MQYLIAILTQSINLYLLTFKDTVDYCIVYFVALKVIMEMSKLYFEAQIDESAAEVIHHHPKIKNRGRDISFSQRTLFHKFARLVYKVLRAFYCSVIFYFVPFFVWFINFAFANLAEYKG
mmetsp:Transcript_12164/g.20502  ORF Transcript_12164/g.20502 Transcript_12164/m.20502 type:complete len:120 (-) Transcript_12164:22-381(-)